MDEAVYICAAPRVACTRQSSLVVVLIHAVWGGKYDFLGIIREMS